MTETDSQYPADKEPSGLFRKIFRVVLAIIFVCCLLLALLTLRVNSQRDAVQWIRDHGGDVGYAIETDENFQFRQPADVKKQPLGWLTDYVGVDFISGVVSVILPDGNLTDVSTLSKFPGLRRLAIGKNGLTDASFLKDFNQLQRLSIRDNPVSDLSPIAGLKLQRLDIRGTAITDLSPIQNTETLKRLDMTLTKITDIKPLENLVNLQSLKMGFTPVENFNLWKNLPTSPR